MIYLFKRYLTKYWKQVSFVMVLLLAQAIANLYLPELNADIINNGVSKGNVSYIMQTGGWMLAVTLGLGIISILSVYYGSYASMAFGRDVRAGLFHRVGQFAQTEVNKFGTPSLITRNTNDVQQVQMVLLMTLNVMVIAPFTGIGGIIMALRQDVPLSGILVVIVPLMGIFLGVLVSRALPLFRAMQIKVDNINRIMRETLTGVRVIRAFVRDDFEQKRFGVANEDLTETARRVFRLFALMWPVLMVVMNLSSVAVLWFGAHRATAAAGSVVSFLGIQLATGPMPIGNLVAFLNYIMQILMAVMMATFMFTLLPRAEVSAKRIKDVLLTEPSVTDPEVPAVPAETRGFLEFRNVEFGYPGAQEPVLKDISFVAGPGEITAVIGSTGSGKSTLVNLIPRFYDVTGGSVLIDGVDVRHMKQEDLWAKIGFIPQRAFLFSGTVESNLRYGDESATEDELWHALKVAQGADFVREMPEGLTSPISQGGTSVSGGQRQRLAIARALVKRPEVYVFDDSFSALDFTTDAKLRAALESETRQSTVIIVAQRVSTILHADRIVVLDEGRIAGIGAHDDLMKTCETYREIVYSQLTEEEIA
jgi:ATP-binding cassette subfamily B protein